MKKLRIRKSHRLQDMLDAVSWLSGIGCIPADMYAAAMLKVARGHKEHLPLDDVSTAAKFVSELLEEVVDVGPGYVALAKTRGVFRWWMVPLLVWPSVVQWRCLTWFERRFR